MMKNDKKQEEKVEEVDDINHVDQKVEKEENKNTEVEKLKQKVTDLENQVKRVLADYQNLEKRVASQRQEWAQSASKQLLLRLLPVLDTLEMAGKHSKDQGVLLSIGQFLSILKDEGVEKIETSGKVFDPLVMECVETKIGEDWKVLEETRSGYKLGDIILRPALVVVGKKEIN